MSEERLAEGADIGAEDELDVSLRPRRLDEFIGQEGVKQQLGIFLEAARQRGEALDHVLLAGPPGLGKTSLAGIVAAELEVGFHVTSGPVLERKGDLAAVLTALEPHDVLFIDEIHRLNRAVEEVLYPAMEDFQLDVVLGQGPSARTLRLDLPRFTLIGATTRTGLLTTPLRGRFGVLHRLDYYGADDLAAIVRRSARLLGVGDRRRGLDGAGRAARAARRASPTACCAGCGTSPRCGATRRSTAPSPRRRWSCSRSTSSASTSSTASCCAGWPRRSRAARWGSARWPTAWASRRTRSRTSTSPTCSRRAC